VYDFVRTETPARNRQQFWVTLCQEGDIRERILRLGVEQEDICEVTTTANALIAAYRATCPLSSRAVLVHLGAQSTVIVVLLAGQGAFASSFQMGGDFFTRALARLRRCTEEAAESAKRDSNLLSGPEASTEFMGVVDGWVAELKRQLSEWLEHNPGFAPGATSVELVASGGGFDQPGLLDYLKAKAGLDLRRWPKGTQSDAAFPEGFEVAFGTALQALGYSPQPVSLLPDDYRLAWQKRLGRQRIELASLALAIICMLVLAVGTWHKLSLVGRKQALLAKVQAGQEAVEANDALIGDLAAEYENLRPIFAAQQNTIDTLKAMALLQQSRSNRNLWFAVLADQQSYFRPPALLSTNAPPRTGLLGAALDSRLLSAIFRTSPAALTNLATAKPGLIAELCVPGDAEAARQVLSELVNGLKQQPLFSKADLLSDDLRRALAEPKVIVPDRHFALALDFAETDFQQPIRLKKSAGAPSRPIPRRLPRPAWSVPESGESVTRKTP
jgi:hypothetical protein